MFFRTFISIHLIQFSPNWFIDFNHISLIELIGFNSVQHNSISIQLFLIDSFVVQLKPKIQLLISDFLLQSQAIKLEIAIS